IGSLGQSSDTLCGSNSLGFIACEFYSITRCSHWPPGDRREASPPGTWARRRGSDRNTPSAVSLAELLQQYINAGLNIRVVDVADRTRRGLNKVDDIGAIGQFARRHPFTDV